MNFRQLRQFIDDSLQELSASSLNSDHPRSKDEFLALWEMLREKVDGSDLPVILPDPVKPQFPPPAPSEQLRSLLDQREQLTEALAAARRNPSATKRSIKKLQRKLKFLEQDYAQHRDAYLRPYWEAKAAQERSKRQREAEVLKMLRFGPRRRQIAERVRKDIERTFKLDVCCQVTPIVP